MRLGRAAGLLALVVAPALVLALEPGPGAPEGKAVLHYHRPRADYESWGLHVWETFHAPEDLRRDIQRGGRTLAGVSWTSPLPWTGADDFGVYWLVDLKEFGNGRVNYIIHRGERKDQCSADKFWILTDSREAWVNAGDCHVYLSRADALRARGEAVPAAPAPTPPRADRSAPVVHRVDPKPSAPPPPPLSSNAALVKAVTVGDVGGVQAALAAGAAPDARDGSVEPVPVLVIAADAGSDEIVEALLARGADPNSRISRRTALMAAARGNHARVVRLLLDAGADVGGKAVDADFASGATALHFAAMGGYSEVVRLLLDGGADPAARTDLGASVLKWAALLKDPETIKVLNAAVQARAAAPGREGPTEVQQRDPAWDRQKTPPDLLAQLAAKAVVLRAAEYFWTNPDQFNAKLSGPVKFTFQGEGGTPVDRLYRVGSAGIHVANLTLRVIGQFELVPPWVSQGATDGGAWMLVVPGELTVDAKNATFLVTGSFASEQTPGRTIWLEGDFRFDADLLFSQGADPVRLAHDARRVEFEEGAKLHVGRDTFSWAQAGWKALAP